MNEQSPIRSDWLAEVAELDSVVGWSDERGLDESTSGDESPAIRAKALVSLAHSTIHEWLDRIDQEHDWELEWDGERGGGWHVLDRAWSDDGRIHIGWMLQFAVLDDRRTPCPAWVDPEARSQTEALHPLTSFTELRSLVKHYVDDRHPASRFEQTTGGRG